VTVLFTDLVGSTELLSSLGEAAFDALRRVHFGALRDAIDHHGGEEIKTLGDGMLTVFGSAADAVNCAVAMQQAVDRRIPRGAAPLAIRIGLALGDVTFEENDVFGIPVVEAARLVAAARAGQILVTALVRAVGGGRSGATFTDLGPLSLKGLPEPVPTCEVAWEPHAEPALPLPALLTDVGPIFVGRDGDLQRLAQLWKEAAAGERRVALLAGEPGVGKTRLAAELAGRAHAEGAALLAGRCDEDLGVPYQPFVEALRHFVDHTPADQLSGRVGRYGGELVRLVPELAEVLPGVPPPLRSDPETERYRLFDAVAGWLVALSAEQPVLLVIDDLQWAAKPTLLLFRHVARSAEPMQLLIVGTYRDTELGHDHPLVEVLADLRRQSGVERFSLQGLDEPGVVAYVEHAAGRALGDEELLLARTIHEETEGNPFFVREVLRHLAETGAVEQREEGWATRLPVEELGIPEGVREVVGRRLARLSDAALPVLRMAAVAGAEFEVPVLRAAGDLDEEDVIAALEEAGAARLVIETPGGRYRFSHALVRHTLYDGLSTARRPVLHRRVAEAIEAAHAGRLDDYLPALALHYSRACAPTPDTGTRTFGPTPSTSGSAPPFTRGSSRRPTGRSRPPNRRRRRQVSRSSAGGPRSTGRDGSWPPVGSPRRRRSSPKPSSSGWPPASPTPASTTPRCTSSCSTTRVASPKMLPDTGRPELGSTGPSNHARPRLQRDRPRRGSPRHPGGSGPHAHRAAHAGRHLVPDRGARGRGLRPPG
jgi:class 3 adenylate cyclase